MKIGILGGIGPEATSHFYSSLISRIQELGIKSNTEFPQIIINSIPAPEILDGGESLEIYKKGIKELSIHNPDFIIMVCNTIHSYYDELSSTTDIKILNLREEVERYLDGEKIAIFATPRTIKSKLYEFKNVDYAKISEQEMLIFSRFIKEFNLKNNWEKISEDILDIAKDKTDNGYKILLACTEFSLFFKDYNIEKIDTFDILLSYAIDMILQN